MKYIKISYLAIVFLVGCKSTNINKTNTTVNNKEPKVYADAETDPVTISGDAADDVCVWIHPTDVMKSTIIGTNKKEGLEVYDLNGKIIKRYKIGKVNNVDIRYGFSLNGKKYPIVTASNRSNNTISVLIVKENGDLEEVSSRLLTSSLQPIYGLGMYKSAKTGKFYTFVVGKKGGVEQWELFAKKGKIDGKIVRRFNIGTKGEGIVADDTNAKVYIGEEDRALWMYEAEPNSPNYRKMIVSVKDPNMKDDFEGVTIYDKGQGRGYVILSSQGNNSYAVFDRNTHEYLGSFSIADGSIDGTMDTDGIDVVSIPFGNKYPKGIFIAQDYKNTNGKKELNQNFKIVNWQKIETILNLN